LEKKYKQLQLETQQKEAAQKQVEEKNKELNNLIAMFAHNFLGTLQCIRSNAEHDNNVSIHLKTVKMMSGALTAFSIISADDDKLIEQLKQDNTGETNLLQNLANNLALAISQLLSKTNKDKIINIYLNYLQKTNQIEIDTTSEELRENRDYRKKWQALQHQWEDEFNALFSENVELSSLQTWLADNFFPVQITGFDNDNIHFKEYGITDSIFLVVFMEILVNALKYMDVSQNQPLKLTLDKQDQHYHIICENPSSQETYRGTHKGMDFLKSIARKLNAQFITESTEQQFKTSFIIPAELLD
jgi:signal transduction histidine kinase